MADIRINSLPSTATSFNTDDYIAIDGASGGTRKMLAATLPLTDVTLGASGPSVKSSLSARAPRQGLVFDGTTGASVSVPAMTDGSVAFWINPSLAGANNFPVIGAVGSYSTIYITPAGRVVNEGDGATYTSTLTANKWGFCVVTKSGNAITYYINGVSVGNYTQTNPWNASDSVGKLNYNSWAASVSGLNVYNRALSASEVVSLYEAGAPAGADYVNGGTTAPTGGTFLNYQYDTFTGASATGFTAAETGGQNCVAYSNYTSGVYAVGTKIKVTFSATLTSGATPSVYLANLAGTPVATAATVVAGSNSQTFTLTTATTVAQHLQLVFSTSGNTSYAISSVVVQPLGLLLAPDAAQAGGGLVWYDTSGNAANITLPASGVSWNVPSSSKVATGWSYTGALNTTKVGAGSSVLNMGFFAGTTFAVAATDGIGIGDSGAGAYKLIQSYGGAIALNPGGNNVWIGKNSDSANGVLQLATHTTSAGGIGFGTDISLYRKGAYVFGMNGVSDLFVEATGAGVWLGSAAGTYQVGMLRNGSDLKFNTGSNTLALTLDSSQAATFAGAVNANGAFNAKSTLNLIASGVTTLVAQGSGNDSYLDVPNTNNGSLYLRTLGTGSIILRTANTTALTLDSSQHFKLTPSVASSIITTQSAPQIRMGSRASGRSNVVLDSTAGRVWSLENTGTSLTVGYSGLDAVTIAETTGDATFAGKVTANGAGSTFKGTATNDSAAAGYVGELISATDNTGVSLTTGTRVDVVSISLTAGDWDVTGYVGYLPSGGASSTYQEGSISATSATIGAAGARTLLKMTTTAQVEFPIPTVRVSLSGTTTYYLVTNNDFTGGTMKGTGIIRARRVR